MSVEINNTQIRQWIDESLKNGSLAREQAELMVIEGVVGPVDWVWVTDNTIPEPVQSLKDHQVRAHTISNSNGTVHHSEQSEV